MLTIAVSYTPKVGDRITCSASARNAVVTMMSHGHIVAVINGKESTFERGEFIRLAERSMAKGATLARKEDAK